MLGGPDELETQSVLNGMKADSARRDFEEMS